MVRLQLGHLLVLLLGAQLARAQPTDGQYAFSVLAGAPPAVYADGPATLAAFNYPQGVVVDAAGNYYVADSNNGVIRRVSADGIASTLAGNPDHRHPVDGVGASAGFHSPNGLALEPAGNLIVADGAGIRRVTMSGAVTTIAGGTGSGIQFSAMGVAVDASGMIYVADGINAVVRKVTPAGVVTAIAGRLGVQGTLDGAGVEARFGTLTAIAISHDGNLLVTDNLPGSETTISRVCRVTPEGVVSTLRDNRNVVGFRAEDSILFGGVTAAADGTIFATLRGSGGVIRINRDGSDDVVAGGIHLYTSLPNGLLIRHGFMLGYADGAGREARFIDPSGISWARDGSLYVTDSGANVIKRITAESQVSTIAGLPGGSGFADGRTTKSRFLEPYGIAVGPNGDVYVTDAMSHTIRRINAAGDVTTIAGAPGESGYVDGPASVARFSQPHGIAVDSSGVIYVADFGNGMVRKIALDGVVSTVAGVGTTPLSPEEGNTLFYGVADIAVDRHGVLYVTDVFNHVVRKIRPDGQVSILAGKRGEPGTRDGHGSEARFHYLWGLAVADDGTVFVAESSQSRIRQITPDGTVSTLAGSGLDGSEDGPGNAASFLAPQGLTMDSAGNLLVLSGRSIRRVARNGMTTTLHGTPIQTDSPISQLGSAGWLRRIAVDAQGRLYVTDPYNRHVLKGTRNGYSRLTNLSVRARSGIGADVLILGFATRGSVSKQILVRASGPSLSKFGVPDVLRDPRLTLFSGNGHLVAENDDWGGTQRMRDAATVVGAFQFDDPAESTLLVGLEPGGYTAHANGRSGQSGNSLLELYEVGLPEVTARLVNLSARNRVAADNVLIVGFTIAGGVKKQVLIRAIGPSLVPYGVADPLPDPRLTVFDSARQPIASNDNWGGAADVADASIRTGAFPVPAESLDAALLLTLEPGGYTAHVTGGGGEGVALIEVYDADPRD